MPNPPVIKIEMTKAFADWAGEVGDELKSLTGRIAEMQKEIDVMKQQKGKLQGVVLSSDKAAKAADTVNESLKISTFGEWCEDNEIRWYCNCYPFPTLRYRCHWHESNTFCLDCNTARPISREDGAVDLNYMLLKLYIGKLAVLCGAAEMTGNEAAELVGEFADSLTRDINEGSDENKAKPKPIWDAGGWRCTCGLHNIYTWESCPVCGTARPERQSRWATVEDIVAIMDADNESAGGDEERVGVWCTDSKSWKCNCFHPMIGLRDYNQAEEQCPHCNTVRPPLKDSEALKPQCGHGWLWECGCSKSCLWDEDTPKCNRCGRLRPEMKFGNSVNG